MTGINERQSQILNQIIQEYINSAEPVSSRLIQRKREFQVCPATIRNEMQKLTELGYLEQPHTSAGRVPTDKAYRFFVDNLIKTDFDKKIFNLFQEIVGESKDTLDLAHTLTKNLSGISFNLTIGWLPERNLVFKEGWEQVLQEPEFREFDYGLRFVKLVNELEQEIKNLEHSGMEIYIGKENPVLKSDDFSMIVSECDFPKQEKAVFLILGPKRMAYDKNINLINSVNRLLESL
jgi:heat-inducible transcriptional repressor